MTSKDPLVLRTAAAAQKNDGSDSLVKEEDPCPPKTPADVRVPAVWIDPLMVIGSSWSLPEASPRIVARSAASAVAAGSASTVFLALTSPSNRSIRFR